MAWLKRKNILISSVIAALAFTFVLSCSIISFIEGGHTMTTESAMASTVHQHLTTPLSQPAQPIVKLILLVAVLGAAILFSKTLFQNIIENWRIAFRDYRARISEHISLFISFLFQQGIVHPKLF